MAQQTENQVSRRHLAALAGCAALGACEPGNGAAQPVHDTLDLTLAATVMELATRPSQALAQNQLVLAGGYAREGDGGGGFFRWQPASRARADNVIVFLARDGNENTAGRWVRDLTGQTNLVAEAGGCRDDDSTDNAPLIRRVIDAAAAHGIALIDFPGRDTGVYRCSGKIVNATTVPGGIVLRGTRPKTSAQGILSGSVIRYTGTGYCFDIRNNNGTTEIEGLAFENLSFQCTDNAGGMFDLNYLDQRGNDYTATDSTATPNYLLKTAFRNCHIEGASPASTGTGIRAKKAAQITLDEHCYVSYWKRGIHFKGVENSVIKGRYMHNGRHMMLEQSGTFGNDTNIFPQFMGPTTVHGEASYGLYDTAKATTIYPCLWELTPNATAQWFMGGAGTTFINPNCGSGAIPVFEIGAGLENGKIIGINMRRGTLLAPIVAAPASWEAGLGAGGEPWRLTIFDAHEYASAVIGNHPRIRYLNTDPAAKNSRFGIKSDTAWINAQGAVARGGVLINSDKFTGRWTELGGVTGIDSMTADSTVPTGYVIRMGATSTRGFYHEMQVGKEVHNGDKIRIVIRSKNPTALRAGTWRYALKTNAFGAITDGALTASTSFVVDTILYTLSGFSNGQTLYIGVGAAGAVDAGLDIDSMTIAVCAPNIADTNGASLRELEIEVNRLKALLRSTNQMAG